MLFEMLNAMKIFITILLVLLLEGVAMSYDVHISRGYKYAETGYKEISLQEWKSTIANHTELEPVEYFEGVNPSTNEVIKIETPNSAIYKKKVGLIKKRQIEILLTWKDGIIVTKYTNESDKKYWKEIAAWLNANIYGEEGESI